MRPSARPVAALRAGASGRARALALRLHCVVLYGALVAAGLLVWLSAAGLPAPWVPRFMRRLSGGDFTIRARGVKFDYWRGFELDSPAIYRRGMLGPPAVEARRAFVRTRLARLLHGESPVTAIEVSEARVRLPLLRAATGGAASGTVAGAGPASSVTARRLRPAEILVDVAPCDLNGVRLDRAAALLRSNGTTLRFESLSAALRQAGRGGPLRGDGTYDLERHQLALRLESELDPRALLPALGSVGADTLGGVIRDFRFPGGAPRLTLNVRHAPGGAPPLSVDGSFWFQNGFYRGVELLRADGKVRVESAPDGTTVTLAPLLLVRPEGKAEGRLAVDTGAGTAAFLLDSTVDPVALSRMTGVLTNAAALGLTCRGATVLRASGTVGYRDAARTAVDGAVEARTVGWRRLTADTCRFDLALRGTTNTFSAIEATVCGGSVTGTVAFVLAQDAAPAGYRLDVHARDVDVDKLLRSSGAAPRPEVRGRLGGRLLLAGALGRGAAASARGSGALAVDGGRVFQFPLFGGFSTQVAQAIPGLEFALSQSDLRADLDVAGGRVRSREIQVRGDVLSLRAEGNCGLDGALDYRVQVTLLKPQTLGGRLLRPVLYPISKLFEFRLRGTVVQPDWRLEHFSRELLDHAEATEAPAAP